MKCQILFSGKNKKNISKCRLLKILPRVLSVKTTGSTLRRERNLMEIEQTTTLELYFSI